MVGVHLQFPSVTISFIMNTTKCEEIYVARLLTLKVLVIKTNANKVV
jgi:hypothetical protein